MPVRRTEVNIYIQDIYDPFRKGRELLLAARRLDLKAIASLITHLLHSKSVRMDVP